MRFDDFHQATTKFFKSLKQDSHHADVTLVTDDHKFIPAHKLVLMAHSSFFQKVFNFTKGGNTVSNTIIFISGIKHEILQNILNYVYLGEVTLENAQLDNFFDAAQKLEIASIHKDKPVNDVHIADNYSKAENGYKYEGTADEKEPKAKDQPKKVKLTTSAQNKDKNDLKQYINKNQYENKWECNVCGKKSNQYANIRRHVETHIEGLSFPCKNCSSTFSTRIAMYNHIHRTNCCRL